MAGVADRVAAKLKAIAKNMGSGSVSVGFQDGATYPDGTLVASVAFWNEFGTTRIPPRPFFRTMVAKESPAWPQRLAQALKATGDSKEALLLVGEDINGALISSIVDFSNPPNAPSTIKSKGFNKPLIDTADMVRSTTVKVDA